MTQTTAQRLNLLVLRLSRNWLRVAIIVLTIYTALPIAAPVLMKLGLVAPARVIYFMYSPFCHQFAFRTFFLFGEQAVYPREAAGGHEHTFEEFIADSSGFQQIFGQYLQGTNYPADPFVFSPALQFASREFFGDERMGYKMTLCERDIAIYIAMLVGALLFRRVRHKLRPAPIWLYVILGLAPIGIDGFSQLFGYPPFEFWPVRETLPIFRVVTGLLFGLMNVWLGFPYLEGAFRETREELEAKFAQAGIPV